MIIEIYAFNAKGEALALNGADFDAPDSVCVTSAGDALAYMGDTRSALRYDDDNGVWRRNRVASFRLHMNPGGEEHCPRSARLDAYRREVLARQGGYAAYRTYAAAQAALAR